MLHIRDRARQAIARVVREHCDVGLADELEVIVLDHIKSQHLPTWDDARTTKAYRNMIVRVATALRSDGFYLLKKVLANELQKESLPKLTDREVRPLYWEYQDALDLKKTMDEKKAVEDLAAITRNSRSGFSCAKCRAAGMDPWKVEHTEFQTRSADEPATIFCFCTQCHRRWRM